MTEQKPTYEELENKLKEAESYLRLFHKSIAKYIQKSSQDMSLLIQSSHIAIKGNDFYAKPLDFIDYDSPNFKYLEGNFITALKSD